MKDLPSWARHRRQAACLARSSSGGLRLWSSLAHRRRSARQAPVSSPVRANRCHLELPVPLQDRPTRFRRRSFPPAFQRQRPAASDGVKRADRKRPHPAPGKPQRAGQRTGDRSKSRIVSLVSLLSNRAIRRGPDEARYARISVPAPNRIRQAWSRSRTRCSCLQLVRAGTKGHDR